MDFAEEFRKKTAECEQIVRKYLPPVMGLQKTVIDAMDYSVLAGGKRLRPLLLMESYQLVKPDAERDRRLRPFADRLMASLEMIHTFSLCHDDLPCMDGDRYRRGRESTWYHFGEDMGTLAGDALSLFAFENVGRPFLSEEDQRTDPGSGPDGTDPKDPTENLAALSSSELSCLLRASALLARYAGIYGMLGGQTVDVEKTGKALSREELLFIYRLKTGALLSLPLMLGAVIGGAEEKTVSDLRKAGEDIGIAFQIRDDILDETSTDEVLGKPVGSDEENNKTTWVKLYGLEQAEKDVEQLSDRAMETFRQVPGTDPESLEFLLNLTDMLVSRKK